MRNAPTPKKDLATRLCMRTLESCLEVSTSQWDNRDFPFVKQGILRTAPVDAISSWRLKPLSARTRSPKVNFLKIQTARLSACLLHVHPIQIKKKTHQTSWSNATRYLIVLLCLWFDQVCARAVKFFALSMNISLQSLM